MLKMSPKKCKCKYNVILEVIWKSSSARTILPHPPHMQKKAEIWFFFLIYLLKQDFTHHFKTSQK